MTDGDPFCADSAKLSRSLLMTGVPLIGVGDGRVTSEAVVKQSDGLVLIAANAGPYSPLRYKPDVPARERNPPQGTESEPRLL